MKTGGIILTTIGLIFFLLLVFISGSKNGNQKKKDPLVEKLYKMTPTPGNESTDKKSRSSKDTFDQEALVNELLKISKDNSPQNKLTKSGSPLKNFYDKLKSKGILPNLPNYNRFSRTLNKSEKARKNFYKDLQQTGRLNLPDYKTFNKTLFGQRQKKAKKESKDPLFDELYAITPKHFDTPVPKNTTSTPLTVAQQLGIDPIDNTPPKDNDSTKTNIKKGLQQAKKEPKSSSWSWFFAIPISLILVGLFMVFRGSEKPTKKSEEMKSEEMKSEEKGMASINKNHNIPGTHKIILCISSLIVAAMILFPPTYYYAFDRSAKKTTVFSGYRFIGKLESNTQITQVGSLVNPDVRVFASIFHIEPVRLTFQLIGLLLITGFLVFAFPETGKSK